MAVVRARNDRYLDIMMRSGGLSKVMGFGVGVRVKVQLLTICYFSIGVLYGDMGPT